MRSRWSARSRKCCALLWASPNPLTMTSFWCGAFPFPPALPSAVLCAWLSVANSINPCSCCYRTSADSIHLDRGVLLSKNMECLYGIRHALLGKCRLDGNGRQAACTSGGHFSIPPSTIVYKGVCKVDWNWDTDQEMLRLSTQQGISCWRPDVTSPKIQKRRVRCKVELTLTHVRRSTSASALTRQWRRRSTRCWQPRWRRAARAMASALCVSWGASQASSPCKPPWPQVRPLWRPLTVLPVALWSFLIVILHRKSINVVLNTVLVNLMCMREAFLQEEDKMPGLRAWRLRYLLTYHKYLIQKAKCVHSPAAQIPHRLVGPE